MNPVFWIVAGVVLLVLFALAWWSSGRQRRGIDTDGLRRSRGKTEGDAAMQAGRPSGGKFPRGPGNSF